MLVCKAEVDGHTRYVLGCEYHSNNLSLNCRCGSQSGIC